MATLLRPFRSILATCLLLPLTACTALLPVRDAHTNFTATPWADYPSAESPTGLKPPVGMGGMSDMAGMSGEEDYTTDSFDLWERLRQGFTMPDINHPDVLTAQSRLLNYSKSTRLALQNARRYLPLILDELERRNLPSELALIPLIESSYNPIAGRGREYVGLWQFGSGTARTFNLSLNDWIDERMDITASTRAAFDYLSYLHDLFNGDWHLAIAAYNRGEGTMQRSLAKSGTPPGLAADHIDKLLLPTITRNYLITLQAWENLLSTPDVFGLRLPEGDGEAGLVAVNVPRGLDFETAAQLGGLSVDEIRALNPGYRHNVIHRNNDTLLVPAGKAQQLLSSVAGKQFPEPKRLPNVTVYSGTKSKTATKTAKANKSGKKTAKANKTTNKKNTKVIKASTKPKTTSKKATPTKSGSKKAIAKKAATKSTKTKKK